MLFIADVAFGCLALLLVFLVLLDAHLAKVADAVDMGTTFGEQDAADLTSAAARTAVPVSPERRA